MPAGLPFPFRQVSQLIAKGMSLALPSCCALCAATGDGAVCSDCCARYLAPRCDRCAQCALPLGLPNAEQAGKVLCGSCINRPPAFDATVVATDYAPPADRLVLALKFGSRLALAPQFAALLRNAMAGVRSEDRPDMLTAVPIGASRLAERGFNQALEIARPLSRALGIPLEPRLALRHRETQPQSMLHPDERHSNVRSAFVVPQEAAERLRGLHVGVVDDVMTTGETLNELAATLKRFGAARVTNLVFARTMPK